jgi:hypothetical protein
MGDVISVDGVSWGAPMISDTVIRIKLEDCDLMSVQLTPQSTVKHVLDIVRQSNLFLPDTVTLSFKGQVLNQWNKNLFTDLGVKHDDVFQVRGTVCPLPKGYEFMSNIGMYMETKCVICLDAIPSHKYDCGHINVCKWCYDQGKVIACPVCN